MCNAPHLNAYAPGGALCYISPQPTTYTSTASRMRPSIPAAAACAAAGVAAAASVLSLLLPDLLLQLGDCVLLCADLMQQLLHCSSWQLQVHITQQWLTTGDVKTAQQHLQPHRRYVIGLQAVQRR